MTFKAIIFDMDGLLVDSETVWAQAESRLLARRGHAYGGSNPRSNFIGLRLDEFFEKLSAAFGLTDSMQTLNDELIADMLDIIPSMVVPQPGAQEIIRYAAEQGLPRAIASSSPASVIEAVVFSQGWDELIPLRFTADDVGRGKPAPDVYLYAARHLHVAPADCLALEDSVTGCVAAVAAGMTCYAVPDTSHTPASAFEGVTPHIFADLHAALAALRNRL